MFKYWYIYVATMAMIMILIACDKPPHSYVENEIKSEWPKQLTLIQQIYGNADEENSSQLRQLFMSHLANHLGIDVLEHESIHHDLAIRELANGTLDIMLANPQSYYIVNQLADAELLATLKTEGDDYTAFITRRDYEHIQQLADLEGTTFAFVNEVSAPGYLYPKGTLVQMLNLDPELVDQSGYFFKQVLYTDSEMNSVIGVMNGELDAAAIGINELENIIDSGMVSPQDFKIIARTADIPKAAFIVRGELPEDFKQALREAFTTFQNEHYFKTVHNDPYARFDHPAPNYYDKAIDLLGVIHALDATIDEAAIFE